LSCQVAATRTLRRNVMGARDLSPTSAALDAYDRAVDHDKGTGFETCQMLPPSQPRSRQKAPTISASRASAPTHKPRLISAMARLEFPPWRLPHAIKAAPAIRAIRRWSRIGRTRRCDCLIRLKSCERE